MSKKLDQEIARRRTFGIISHPDAGKTTLTEKLLLYGGAIQLAGAVKARRATRHARSDWMEMEKERGISVTTSVMKFHYRDYEVNLLDTPGHQDFSEDTFRVLTAVDSALMVVDRAKGVERQTERLMEVCRMRNTPVMAFINKMDREGIPPLDLLSDIEDKLQIECAPLAWPVGMGKGFKGVYNLYKKELNLFTAGADTRHQEVLTITDLDDPRLDAHLGRQADELREDIALLEGAANPFSLPDYLRASQSPVFFGSAIFNFGVRELLDAFVELSPPPGPREAESRLVRPEEPAFSGFVFKIQANMDPAHRDRIAFLRVCSGRFHRGMTVRHHRIDKDVTLSSATIFMAQDRSNVDEAWPGDIIGLHNHGTIKIGDTFTEKEPLKFTGIPSFAPDEFRRVRLRSPLKVKQLDKGLVQLAEEGAIQVFRPLMGRDWILGAVGLLQFDVTLHRLRTEYGAEVAFEPVGYATARWVSCEDRVAFEAFQKKYEAHLARDAEGNLAYLAQNTYWLQLVEEQNPAIAFHKTREQA